MKKALSLALLLVVVSVAVGKAMAEDGKVSITVGYRERIALPPDAVLEVELLDVSRADAPSIRISSQRFAMNRTPLSVTLHYDTEVIDQRMAYAVAARILSAEKTLFRSTTNNPTITRGAPTELELILQMMPRGQEAGSSAHGISGMNWDAVEVGGYPVSGEVLPTILFEDDGSFSLFGGCNRFRGKAALSGRALSFQGPIAGTKKACGESLSILERNVLEALSASVVYLKQSSSLVFWDSAGRDAIRFQERPE